MKRYDYGYFDIETFEGNHDNYGKLGIRIMNDINNDVYARFFFEKDTTNGIGISDYNVESWFYRE